MFSFREVEIADAEQIMRWRQSHSVNKYMETSLANNIDEQKAWLASCFQRPNYYHWIVQHGHKDIGLVNFTNWDPENKTTEWGFYIGEATTRGLGGFVPPFLYNFVFNKLDVETINSKVFYNNLNVIRLHLAQGHYFNPSMDSVTNKNGEDILVICLSLAKWTFEGSSFARLKADMPTTRWMSSPFKE